MGRKNISKGKNRELTDFSYLIAKVDEPSKIEKEENKIIPENKIKEE